MPKRKPLALSQSPRAFMPDGNLVRSSTSLPSAVRLGASQQSSLSSQMETGQRDTTGSTCERAEARLTHRLKNLYPAFSRPLSTTACATSFTSVSLIEPFENESAAEQRSELSGDSSLNDPLHTEPRAPVLTAKDVPGIIAESRCQPQTIVEARHRLHQRQEQQRRGPSGHAAAAKPVKQ